MTYLSSLPIELRCELLCYSNDPWWIINEVMSISVFQVLKFNVTFLREFIRKYLSNDIVEMISYEEISKLYIIINNDRSLMYNLVTAAKYNWYHFFKNIYTTNNQSFTNNLITAAKYNWYNYLHHINYTDKRFINMDLEKIVIEATYANSIEFLFTFINIVGHNTLPKEYNDILLSAFAITIIKGYRSMHEFLVPLINHGNGIRYISDAITNKVVKKFDGLSWEDLQNLLTLIVLLLFNNNCNFFLQSLINENGLDKIKKCIISNINKNHIDWIINKKHGILCKSNINYLLSLGLDRNLLSTDQLVLYSS